MVVGRGRGSRGRGNQLDSSRRVATRSSSQTINPNQVPTVINNDKCGICSLSVGNDGLVVIDVQCGISQLLNALA